MSGVRLVMLGCVLSAGLSRADATDHDQARQLYQSGKEAFESRQFQTAYDLFKQSFILSDRAELLFNMSSCLQELGRFPEAATELRTYLRLKPDDPDRPQIERRILTLEEKQRLLQAEQPPAPTLGTTPAPRRSRRALVIGLSLGAAAVVIAGVVTLGVVYGSSGAPPYTDAPLGAHPATR
jgi:tetratricopeptide (TPR) repeat protein